MFFRIKKRLWFPSTGLSLIGYWIFETHRLIPLFCFSLFHLIPICADVILEKLPEVIAGEFLLIKTQTGIVIG